MSVAAIMGREAQRVGVERRQAAATGPTFSPVTALWLVLVGVFTFSALMVLVAYAPDLKTGNDGEAHALSKSAFGYAAAVELLKAEGQPVLISRAKLPRGRTEGLVVATPSPFAELSAIKGLGFAGPVLIVLPKWGGAPDPTHKGWVTNAAPLPTSVWPKTSLLADQNIARRSGKAAPLIHAVDAPFAKGAQFRPGAVDRLQTFRAPGWLPILVDEQGGVILARDPNKPIYVLSDPDFLNTHGLKSLATAQVGLGVLGALRAGQGPVIFDVTLNGFSKERSILRLIFDPPFLAVTLCLAAAAALAGFQAFCRFGPMRRQGRVFALGKEALADNSAALIRLAGREHRMGGRYAALTRSFAGKAVGAPRELAGEALTQFLDRMSRQRGARDTLAELSALAERASDRARLTSAAQRLFRWRLEMTRERQ